MVKTLITDQLRLARPQATVDTVERDAGSLLAMLDGLMYAIVTGQQTGESALAVMRAQLEYVFD